MRSSSLKFQRLVEQRGAEEEGDDGGHPRRSMDVELDGDSPISSGTHSSFQESDTKQLLKETDQGADGETGVSKDRVSASWFSERVSWISLLCKELNVSFVFGIMVVYGAGQGVGGALSKVVVDYYWKDVQLAQPSSVQMYNGMATIPWEVKPLWGLMTDVFPIGGYYRRPYFVLTGVVSGAAIMVLALGGQLWIPFAVGTLIVHSACTALSDATIDAEVATKSRETPKLAADIQSLCAISLSVGSLMGYSSSGVAVDRLGPQGALGVMLIPAVLLLVLGFTLHEERTVHSWHNTQLSKQLYVVVVKLWMTLKDAKVWKPTLYMYLSLAVSPDISEGKFFWYSDLKNGPGFAKEFVGAIYATGSIGTLLAVYFYHKKLRKVSFRKLLLWMQLLIALFGMLDFVLVTRLNRKIGIPDHYFVIGDEGLTQAMGRLKWMPLLILAAKLCPSGIEGTFFSLLMSVDNVGIMTSTWLGALLLRATSVTRTDFTYLWLAVIVRNILRLVPVCLVFLLPNTDPDEDILGHSQEEEATQLVEIEREKESSLSTIV